MRHLAVLLALCSCGTRLTGIASDLSVEPRELSFSPTALGDTRTLPLQLTNGSRAPLDLHVSASAPFALELDVRLGGGESRAVDVGFSPAALGRAAGTLAITGDLSLDVALGGEGVEAAQCTSPSACRLSHRDPVTNACVEEDAADGTPCTDNACLENGQCIHGLCMGTPRSCDDHDACTVDACDPSGGCVHFAAACAEPADKCRVALCDPATGCGAAPAADGTPCGPSDCTTAQVCMAGACKTLPVPDGYACGDESPCRAKGRCASGACNQPPATALVEAWHYELAYQADFRGVVDSQGNLVWVECDQVDRVTPCSLVSMTPDGLLRFRAGVVNLNSTDGSRHLASGGRVYVAGRDGSVSAYSETSGAHLWSRASAGTSAVNGFAADRRGQLHLLTYLQGESEAWGLTTLDAATGALLRTRPLFGNTTEPVLDGQDNVFFLVRDTPSPLGTGTMGMGTSAPGAGAMVHLISLSPAGAVRFVVAMNQIDAPLAALDQRLLLNSGEVRSTLDGTVRTTTSNPPTWWGPSPLMSAAGHYRWNDYGCCPTCDCDSIGYRALEGWSNGATSPRFVWGMFDYYQPRTSEAQLLADGSALFSSTKPPVADVSLRAIDAAGNEKFACFIGNDPDTHWTGATALTKGRWAVAEQVECPSCLHNNPPTLRVYAAGGLIPAQSGWTGAFGNPGRSSAPRQ